MFQSTLKSLPADVAIFSAAVCDYKVKKFLNKIKKQDEIILDLEKMSIFLSMSLIITP